MRKTKTINIDETEYKIAAVTEGQFEEIAELAAQEGKAFEANRLTVALCLNNADDGSRTAEFVKRIPRPDFNRLLNECLDISGLAKNAKAAEETTPSPSTSPTSAAQ